MQRFVPPLLDRLLDGGAMLDGQAVRPSFSVQQLKESVARDLEALLNTRRGPPSEALTQHRRVRASIIAFGLDDFAALSIASSVDRMTICRSIARAITDHEPRLRQVTVELSERDALTQKMPFTIHAVLVVHPLEERVNFDALLQTKTQDYRVLAGHRSGVRS